MPELISSTSLNDLVEANAIQHATVVADKNAFKINVKYGMVERTISVRTRTGQIKERLFTSLDAAARFMREKVHLMRYEIDAAHFEPTPKTSKRPDISKRLIDAHAALSHSEWVQQKVNASLTSLANGTNKVIASEEWEKIRASKKR